MTQPPSQQPPQGGFGAPQDSPQGPPQGAPQGSPYGGAQPPAQPPTPPAQPPQIPAQPPQAPPAPGAGPGYGYPQTPPGGQPGYGYPQAPGQAPGPYQQQPGPYGQQPGPYNQAPGPYQQQPGPYGQQPGPYNPQPGYGYPSQPGAPTAPYGGNPGGPGGKNFLKGKPGVIVAAAVAGLLVVGGGTWFALSGDDGGQGKNPVANKSEDAKPDDSSGSDDDVDTGDGSGSGREANDDLNAGRKDGESKIAWLQTNDVDLPRNGSDVYGPWLVGDTIVKAMYKSVVGYSASDGKKKWTIPTSAPVCAAPHSATDDGKIVIAFEDSNTEKSKCTQLQMIDLTTGKAGWKKTVAQHGTWDFVSELTLAISGDTVAVGRSSNSDGYRVSDGKELFGKQDGDCQPESFAGGAKLIAGMDCGLEDKRVSELDPTTGKAKWSYRLTKGWDLQKVYSLDPLVISVENSDEKTWSILGLTANGTLRSQLDGGKDKFRPNCGGSFIVFGQNLEGCVGVAADASNFYIATAPDSGSTSRTNEVIAFNLDTGKPKWRSKAPEGRTMTPLRMEGGKVLLYMDASYDKGGTVATIEPTGGDPKTIQQHPASTSRIETSFYSAKYLYADGRFYLTSGRVSASNDEEELQTKTMMAFGE
ncbi:PQQ-binding-like beta-propeller repeat protein [Streptomyces sp. NPDC059255]|uniref:outer membrane protein assembly factor BamB family protein n=1 Tax=Streptomyces sp. NPDC059255 TaxID=3346793 RepID=UPI00369DFDC8